MEQTEFKVGDKIKLVKETSYSHIVKGDIATVSHADKYGEEYGFVELSDTSAHWLNVEKNFELVSNAKLKPITHVVVWTEDSDPAKFFTSEKEARKFVKELSDNSSVEKDSIYLVTVKSVKKVKINKTLNLREHKIY